MTANNLFVLQICLGSIMHLYQQQKSNSPSDKKYYKCPLLYKALNPIPNTHTNRDLRTIVCFNFQTQNLQKSHWHFLRYPEDSTAITLLQVFSKMLKSANKTLSKRKFSDRHAGSCFSMEHSWGVHGEKRRKKSSWPGQVLLPALQGSEWCRIR